MADTSIERFRRVVEAAYGHLEERRQEINDLNVFPVADGDTGDNMALTMHHVLDELDRLEHEHGEGEAKRPDIVRHVARAALMGARGNSGVILSQIVRGAAEKLAEPGVGDAGALGLAGIVRGLIAGLAGQTVDLPEIPHYAPARTIDVHHTGSKYQFCTNFIVTGEGLDGRSFVRGLEELGDS